MKETVVLGITFYRARRLDVNGNPRYIVHYTDFLSDKERVALSVERGYQVAAARARACKMRVYRGRDLGGGFYSNNPILDSEARMIINQRGE